MSLTQLPGPVAFDAKQLIGVSSIRTSEIPGSKDRVHSFDIFLQGSALGFGSDNEQETKSAHEQVLGMLGDSFSGGGSTVEKTAVLGLTSITEISGTEAKETDFSFGILVDGATISTRFHSEEEAQSEWNEIAGEAGG